MDPNQQVPSSSKDSYNLQNRNIQQTKKFHIYSHSGNNLLTTAFHSVHNNYLLNNLTHSSNTLPAYTYNVPNTHINHNLINQMFGADDKTAIYLNQTYKPQWQLPSEIPIDPINFSEFLINFRKYVQANPSDFGYYCQNFLLCQQILIANKVISFSQIRICLFGCIP
jgi:hypothetical protein